MRRTGSGALRVAAGWPSMGHALLLFASFACRATSPASGCGEEEEGGGDK